MEEVQKDLKELERTIKELFEAIEPSQLVDILCEALKEKCVRVEEGLINDIYIFEDETKIEKSKIIKCIFDLYLLFVD